MKIEELKAEELARARLNDAAPKLLEACMAAIRSNMVGSNEPSVTISQAAWEDIQDAIAKATGEDK